MTRIDVARRLLRLMRPLAPLMAVSAAARVVNQGLGVAIPAVAATLVVEIGPGAPIGGLLALLAALAVVKGVFRYGEQFTGHGVAFRLLADLRVDLFRRIAPLAPAGLDDERTGDLVARLVGDVDRVEPFYAHTIAPLVSGILVPILAVIGIASWIDPALAFVFAPFPLLIGLAVPWLSARRVAGLAASARDQAGDETAALTDAVQGATEIAVFDARDSVIERIGQRSAANAATRRSLARVASARSVLGDLLSSAAVVAVAVVGAIRLEAGAIELAGLAAAVTVAWVATSPARALEEIIPDLEQALAAAGRLFELSDREAPVRLPTSEGVAPRDGSVVLSRVTARLGRSSRPALEAIDVTVPDRGYVAVVGPSGSGKSTLVELLVRFRDPEGRVEIGGTNIRDLTLSQISDAVTLVPQRPEIFFGTLGDNLRLAKPDAADTALWEALDRAALGSWARSLERGLDTTIGELGDTLSGGQRQRISIARAFLREPQVLVLDEATSELDRETENQVLSELAREMGRRTVIVVAHRLETVVDADEILVMDRGRLVERGRHQALTAAGGVYAGLWSRHLDLVDATDQL